MAKEKSPSYQRYPRDYLSDVKVQVMTLEEEGMYNRLLDYCWLEKSLPADADALKALCKGVIPTARVVQCFVEKDGVLVHPRLDIEREKQEVWRQKSALGGRRSAHKRKHTKEKRQQQGGSQMVDVCLQPKRNSSLFSFQSSNNKTPQSPPGGNGAIPQQNALFEAFYDAYPRHENPMGARKAFEKAGITANDLPQILDWIEKAVKSSQWQDRDKIPHPATFLNQRRWQGDPPPQNDPISGKQGENLALKMARELKNGKAGNG